MQHLFNAESESEGGGLWDWLTEGENPVLSVKLERVLAVDHSKGGVDTSDGAYVKFSYEVDLGPFKFEMGAKYVYETGLDPLFKYKYSQELAKYGKLKFGGTVDVLRGIEKSFSTAIDSGYGYLSTQSRGAVYINRYKERQREYLSNF